MNRPKHCKTGMVGGTREGPLQGLAVGANGVVMILQLMCSPKIQLQFTRHLIRCSYRENVAPVRSSQCLICYPPCPTFPKRASTPHGAISSQAVGPAGFPHQNSHDARKNSANSTRVRNSCPSLAALCAGSFMQLPSSTWLGCPFRNRERVQERY